MEETQSYKKITFQQKLEIEKYVWMVAFKKIEEQWWCNIMILEGRTERIVNGILSKI
jgi:hypothetical protein